MQARERERHPVSGEHLDVRNLRHPVRRKPEREAGHERAIVASRDGPGQEVGRQRPENERQEERRVVGEQRIAAHQDHGRRDDRQSEQVLGKRHRPLDRKELRGVPPGGRQREHAGVPRHQPGVEQRIAKVVGHDAAGVQHQRPRDRRREDNVETGREENWEAGPCAHQLWDAVYARIPELPASSFPLHGSRIPSPGSRIPAAKSPLHTNSAVIHAALRTSR